MNRRGFLSFLTAAAAAPLVPMPELDLGRRIFLPPRIGWPLLTAEMISREALRILHENMRFVSDYDITRDQLVGRCDVILGGTQMSADHILGPNHNPEQAKEQSARLFLDAMNHRQLSIVSIKRPPRYV